MWRSTTATPGSLRIYEGTNGIQAADLVGRKLAMRGGDVVHELLAECDAAAGALAAVDGSKAAAEQLAESVAIARRATDHLLSIMATDQRSLLAGSAPYLRLLGTVACAGLLTKGAVVAADRDDDFHRAKVVSARFFLEQILPTTSGLLPAIVAPADDLYALTPAQLA